MYSSQTEITTGTFFQIQRPQRAVERIPVIGDLFFAHLFNALAYQNGGWQETIINFQFPSLPPEVSQSLAPAYIGIENSPPNTVTHIFTESYSQPDLNGVFVTVYNSSTALTPASITP